MCAGREHRWMVFSSAYYCIPDAQTALARWIFFYLHPLTFFEQLLILDDERLIFWYQQPAIRRFNVVRAADNRTVTDSTKTPRKSIGGEHRRLQSHRGTLCAYYRLIKKYRKNAPVNEEQIRLLLVRTTIIRIYVCKYFVPRFIDNHFCAGKKK